MPEPLPSRSPLSKLIDLYWSEQFLRFLFVGGIAVVVHWLARIALSTFMPFWLAIIVAYGVGVLTAYLLNRRYVFPSSKSPERELTLFVLVNLAAFPFVWLIAYGLAEYVFPAIGYTFQPQATAHGIAILSPVFANFAAHKFVTFKAP